MNPIYAGGIDLARRWADVLQEQKVHMVGATLSLVGEHAMQCLAEEAKRQFELGNASSLGGGFVLVMKHRGIYSAVKEMSGEKRMEQERVKKRIQRRKRRDWSLTKLL
jgi:hypothetical protein